MIEIRFVPVQNNITLKHGVFVLVYLASFVPVQNNITLKQ